MKIVLNIEKRYAYLILGFLILGVGIIVVNAYNSAGTGGTPSVMGHSVDEIDWSQTIESLKVNSINLNGVSKSNWPGGSSSASWGECIFVDAGFAAKCPEDYFLVEMDRFSCSHVSTGGACWAKCCKIKLD